VNSSVPKGQAVPAPLDFTEFEVNLEDFMTKKMIIFLSTYLS